MRSLMLLTVTALTLTACASGRPPMPVPSPILFPPASLTEACPPLPQPATGKAQAVLENHVETARLYHQCRNRQQDLADWLRVTGATGHDL